MPSLIRLVQCLISLPFCQTMWKEYSLLPVPPPAPLDGIGAPMRSLLPGHMPNLIQLVQGTEQVLPTAMIRYMVVVLAR